MTERDHLLAYARTTGETPPELQPPPLPGGCELLWTVFLQLHGARGGGMGPAPISMSDLLAYQQLHGIELNPWELDVLHQLDQVALSAAAEQQKNETRK